MYTWGADNWGRGLVTTMQEQNVKYGINKLGEGGLPTRLWKVLLETSLIPANWVTLQIRLLVPCLPAFEIWTWQPHAGLHGGAIWYVLLLYSASHTSIIPTWLVLILQIHALARWSYHSHTLMEESLLKGLGDSCTSEERRQVCFTCRI